MTRIAVSLSLLAQILTAQETRNFIACPILRDTKTVPCWLAEYEGEIYYLGVQPDAGGSASAPQQAHEVLVEGTVKPGPKVCGGIPLSPVTISVLPELNRGCNTVLSAKDEIEAPPAEKPQLELSAEAPFALDFEFDSDRISAQGMRVIERVAAAHPTRVEVTVSRGSVLLSDGRTLTETEATLSRRANKIAAALAALGMPASSVSVQVEPAPSTARRALISVTP
jgi:hypothetical protein